MSGGEGRGGEVVAGDKYEKTKLEIARCGIAFRGEGFNAIWKAWED